MDRPCGRWEGHRGRWVAHCCPLSTRIPTERDTPTARALAPDSMWGCGGPPHPLSLPVSERVSLGRGGADPLPGSSWRPCGWLRTPTVPSSAALVFCVSTASPAGGWGTTHVVAEAIVGGQRGPTVGGGIAASRHGCALCSHGAGAVSPTDQHGRLWGGCATNRDWSDEFPCPMPHGRGQRSGVLVPVCPVHTGVGTENAAAPRGRRR